MEVLQIIHTQGDSRSGQTWNSLPSSQEQDRIAEDAIVIDSDDEDEALAKRSRFGSHLSSFSFKPEAVAVLPFRATPAPNKIPKASCTPRPALRVLSRSPQPQNDSDQTPMQEDYDAAGSSTASCSTRQLPELPDSLVTTLRGFPTCPLCLQAFPNLNIPIEPLTKKFNAKKAAAKLAALKKAKTAKTITGAARLTHVQMCALRTGTSSEAIISLIGKEQVRLDRNKRREYNEEVSRQGVWKTLTGDAPPSTQVQQASVKVRGKKRGKPVEVVPPKGKSSATTVAFKAGKRGGLNRASTLIMAPRLTRALVKQRCNELFGLPPEVEEDIYEDHVESTIRCQQASSSRAIKLGLGVGACSIVSNDREIGAAARLGMGYCLGTVIAQRFKASH